MLTRLLFTLLIGVCASAAIGCAQLPKTVAKIVDANVNKTGLRPELERKPLLKRIADPANLQPEAPEVLKTAGKIKEQEDLAPQKVKALKYLGKVGCGCYNKKNADMVEAALMEALDDCTPAVRTAALQAIVASAGGSCACPSPDTCNGSACCTEKILKKMDEMAFKQDDKGCFAEPDVNVRNLAAHALTVCPPLPPKPMVEGGLKETYYQPFNYGNPGAYIPPAAPKSKLIDSKVFDLEKESATFSLQFTRPYQLPTGSDVLVSAEEDEFECTIVASQAGSVLLKTKDTDKINSIAKNDSLKIGLLTR